MTAPLFPDETARPRARHEDPHQSHQATPEGARNAQDWLLTVLHEVGPCTPDRCVDLMRDRGWKGSEGTVESLITRLIDADMLQVVGTGVSRFGKAMRVVSL